jgi:hypothetical protein
MQLQSKQKEKNQEVENLPNLKDVIQHRPVPRKILSMSEKMEKLKTCIDKIQSLKDVKKKNDLKISNSKHNHEIKSKSDATSDKQLKEKKIPGKRGRKKKIVS